MPRLHASHPAPLALPWIVLLAGLVAAPAALGGTPAANLADLSLEELLDLEITTASKRAESLSESPSFTHVITREEIRSHGYRTVAEALSGIVGLYATNVDHVWDGVGVRGFAVSGDYSTRVLVLIDGQRLNEPMGDSPSLGEEIPLDIEGIERIEVVKGPGSALWGSNALLAIVNVVPRRGSKIDGVESRLEYGSFERWKGTVTAGKRFGNGLEVAALIGGLDAGGDDRIAIQALGNAHDQDEEDLVRGHLVASYGDWSFGFYASNRNKEDPTGGYETIFDSPFDGTFVEEQQFLAQLRYQRAVLPEWEGQVSARLFHSTYDYRGEYEYDQECCNFVLPYHNHDRIESKSYGSELQLSLSPHERLDLTGGIEAQHHYEIDFRNADLFGIYADGSGAYHTLAGYLQGRIRANDWLQVVVGSRLDDYSNFSAEVSPRAAVIVTPRKGTAIKLLFGQAFRAPNVYETAFDDGEKIASSLGPETIRTYEAIVDQHLFGHTRLVGGVFYYEIDDLIAEFANPDETVEYRNAGTVTSRGLELALQTALPSGLRARLGFSALKAEDDGGRWLSNSPRYLGNAAVSVPLFARRLVASLELQAVGRRRTLAGNSLPPAFTSNLVLRHRVLDWLEATLGVYNLLDDDVRIPSGNQQLANGTEHLRMRGRSFSGSFRVRF
ncbi:MAG: TonB-dependent receptor [Myxococcales bacterium]|nr:TonB-dependent receptor [Myxococcales bacterium]